VVKTDKVRADTTVVEANVAYPTDSELLVRAICLIVSLVARNPRHRGGVSHRRAGPAPRGRPAGTPICVIKSDANHAREPCDPSAHRARPVLPLERGRDAVQRTRPPPAGTGKMDTRSVVAVLRTCGTAH
jgi:IS5 family transposase